MRQLLNKTICQWNLPTCLRPEGLYEQVGADDDDGAEGRGMFVNQTDDYCSAAFMWKRNW